MWIIPKNLDRSSYAPVTLEYISDLNELSRISEQSFMWRSKPSPMRTWLQRWKRVTWMRHLSGRILKRSMRNLFEIEYTLSLEVIRVSHFQPPARDSGQMIQDTFGRIFTKLSKQLDLFSVSSRTSKDTYRLDSKKYNKAFEILVIELRAEYSVRLNVARHNNEKDCSSSVNWPTPDLMPDAPNSGSNKKNCPKNFKEGINWPTPASRDHKGQDIPGRNGGVSLPHMVQTGEISHNGQADQGKNNTNGNRQELWATPRTVTGGAESAKRKQELGRTESGGGDLQSQTNGKLNARWVETLMSLKIGWTMPSCINPVTIEPTNSDYLETE